MKSLIQPLCNMLEGKGILVRSIPADCDAQNRPANWRAPEKQRFDLFIREYLTEYKRSYFSMLPIEGSIEENLFFALNEAGLDKDTVKTFKAQLLVYEPWLINTHLSEDIQKNFYYIDLSELKIRGKKSLNPELKSREQLDEILIEYPSLPTEIKQYKDRLVAIKVHSCFIGYLHDWPSFQYGAYNCIILDNNPLYDLLVNTEPQVIKYPPEKNS